MALAGGETASVSLAVSATAAAALTAAPCRDEDQASSLHRLLFAVGGPVHGAGLALLLCARWAWSGLHWPHVNVRRALAGRWRWAAEQALQVVTVEQAAAFSQGTASPADSSPDRRTAVYEEAHGWDRLGIILMVEGLVGSPARGDERCLLVLTCGGTVHDASARNSWPFT